MADTYYKRGYRYKDEDPDAEEIRRRKLNEAQAMHAMHTARQSSKMHTDMDKIEDYDIAQSSENVEDYVEKRKRKLQRDFFKGK